jgi:myo-inositol-1(or 4)-monophosphatase
MTAPTTPADDLDLLRSVAVTAGIIATGFFRRDIKKWTKEHDSPVSEADVALDRLLNSSLLAARPDYGWLSEETVDSDVRLGHRRIFVVDPIDGTRGFIAGDDSWAVSLAVVEDGVPIAGVIYAPVRDEMYEAALGGGALLNGKPLVRNARSDAVPLIPLPGAVHQQLQTRGLVYKRGPAFASLAYRLVQVAAGRLDAAVARRGSQEWDVAAAAVILAEAGIELCDVCTGALRFNRAETRLGALAAVADQSLKPILQAALIEVYGCPQAEQTNLEARAP